MHTPTESEFQSFLFILNIHKHLVKNLGELFTGKDYSAHDNSKLEEPEKTPYTLRFIRKLNKEENPQWEEGKQHHFATNDHHVEYWKYYAKSEMPEDRLLEAIIDMMAAKFQYNLCPEVEDYVRIGEFDIDYEKLEGKLKEFLKKPEMYFFKDRYLSEYDEKQKMFINSKLSEFQKSYNKDHIEL